MIILCHSLMGGQSILPKNIHQIWFGGNPPKRLMNRIERLHPDWNYQLWTEDNLPFRLYNQKLFDEARYPAERSDILRYELLYEYGGIYLDADCFALRPLTSFMRDSFSTFENEQRIPGLVQNGMMGFTPKHPILKEIMYRIKTTVVLRHNINCCGSTGPYLLSNVLKEAKEEEGILLYPSQDLLPLHHSQMSLYSPEQALDYAKKKGSYIFHLWGSVIHYNSPLFEQYQQLAKAIPLDHFNPSA